MKDRSANRRCVHVFWRWYIRKLRPLGNLFLCTKHTSKDDVPSCRSLEMSLLGLALEGAGVSYCGVWPSGLHALWLTSSGIGVCA